VAENHLRVEVRSQKGLPDILQLSPGREICASREVLRSEAYDGSARAWSNSRLAPVGSNRSRRTEHCFLDDIKVFFGRCRAHQPIRTPIPGGNLLLGLIRRHRSYRTMRNSILAVLGPSSSFQRLGSLQKPGKTCTECDRWALPMERVNGAEGLTRAGSTV